MIFKFVGGIGVVVSCIWVIGSYIVGINGNLNGFVLMLRVYNNIVWYVD